EWMYSLDEIKLLNLKHTTHKLNYMIFTNEKCFNLFFKKMSTIDNLGLRTRFRKQEQIYANNDTIIIFKPGETTGAINFQNFTCGRFAYKRQVAV
ncbi:hypothetical protein ACJX0J_011460, partial [Zea mays]